MRIIGIDPGLSGAWALVVDGRPDRCGDMPVAGDGTLKRVSARVLSDLIISLQPNLVVVERVGAMPAHLHGRQQGNASTFRFGMSFGAVLAIVNVVGVPLELVMPAVWKRHHGLIGTDKEASRLKALDLAPNLSTSLARKLDTGRAEAILIGLYGEVTWGQGRAAA